MLANLGLSGIPIGRRYVTKLSVLIVDDNPLYVAAATQFLINVCGVEVVGVAGSGDEGIAHARALEPDLVLIDQGMNGMTGLETAAKLKALKQPPVVVIVTLNANRQLREHAVESGCEAVLSKIDFARDIPGCIEAVVSRRRNDGAGQGCLAAAGGMVDELLS